MDATRIVAIRHGETDWNVAARIQGHTDIPLNALGRQQAARVAAALADAGERFDAVYSSDLARAHQTAQAVADRTLEAGGAVRTDRGLRERAFGAFEGRTFVDVEAERPADALQWRQRHPGYAPPGGESLAALRQRVRDAVDRIAAAHTGGSIALVAHGGVLDTLYRLATGQTIEAPRTWVLGNATINRLLWTPDAITLVGWNDAAHLAAPLDEATA